MLQHTELDIGGVEVGDCPMVMVLSVKGKSTVAWLYHFCPYCTVSWMSLTTEYIQYRCRGEIGGVYLPSLLERTYTTTLLLIVDRVKGGGSAPPP
jgi:hypothetical protein